MVTNTVIHTLGFVGMSIIAQNTNVIIRYLHRYPGEKQFDGCDARGSKIGDITHVLAVLFFPSILEPLSAPPNVPSILPQLVE